MDARNRFQRIKVRGAASLGVVEPEVPDKAPINGLLMNVP